MSDRKAVLFSADYGDREYLTATTVQEAVREWADERLDEQLPAMVTVYGYARAPVYLHASCLLEEVLERLDEDYAGEDATEATEAMKAAAQVFCTAVMAEYTPWACEQITTEEVVVAEHLDELSRQMRARHEQ